MGLFDFQKGDQTGCKTNTSARNTTLDALKGICILLVIFTHCRWTDEQRSKLFFWFWVEMAVPVFMIISGYLYARSFERHQVDSFEKAYDWRRLLPRIIRFTIPFLIAYWIEEAAFIVIKGSFDPIHAGQRLLTGGVGPGSYYYPVMIQFIFYFPVLFFLIKRHGEKGFLICIAVNFIYELLQRAYGMNEECYRLLVFRYTLVIAFGCYMAVCQMKAKPWMLLTFAVIGIAYITMFKCIGMTPPITIYWTSTSYLASMYVIPIVYLLMKYVKIRFKPLELLGKASFNIFLVQMVYFGFAGGQISEFVENMAVQIAINFAVCIVGGVVFFLIESRITHFVLRSIIRENA